MQILFPVQKWSSYCQCGIYVVSLCVCDVLQVQIAPIRVCVKDVTDPSLTASSCAWTTARGTRSVCSALCVSSFSPWAATPETRNSTANTTTNSKSWFTHLQSCVSSSVARRDISLRRRVFWCVFRNISKRLFFVVVLWDSVVVFTRNLRLGYKIQAYYISILSFHFFIFANKNMIANYCCY